MKKVLKFCSENIATAIIALLLATYICFSLIPNEQIKTNGYRAWLNSFISGQDAINPTANSTSSNESDSKDKKLLVFSFVDMFNDSTQTLVVMAATVILSSLFALILGYLFISFHDFDFFGLHVIGLIEYLIIAISTVPVIVLISFFSDTGIPMGILILVLSDSYLFELVTVVKSNLAEIQSDQCLKAMYARGRGALGYQWKKVLVLLLSLQITRLPVLLAGMLFVEGMVLQTGIAYNVYDSFASTTRPPEPYYLLAATVYFAAVFIVLHTLLRIIAHLVDKRHSIIAEEL